MPEIRAEFRCREQWRLWAHKHRARLDTWRVAVLADVARDGLVDPIAGTRHSPEAIAINPDHLRESLSAAGLNSRKRAGLLLLENARRSLPPERKQRPRILGAEAITKVARLLRGRFIQYLGAEYLPTEEERREYYPIPHLDLSRAAFPDAAFDLFYSGDVLEHVPDVPRALSEIRRMLAAGGIMVSSFPFDPTRQKTLRRASLDGAGSTVHHLPPEYHDNPTRPSEGSLVYSVPGWDIIDQAASAGFADACIKFVVSSRHGVVAAPLPGIFVMVARVDHPRSSAM